MRTNKTLEHPDDAKLLAFLDGELCLAEACVVKTHMNRCWKCRTALADLESQVEDVSRLLSVNSYTDEDRSILAKARFLEWKKAFEKKKANFHLWRIDLSLSLLAATGRTRISEKLGRRIESISSDSLAPSQCLLAAFEI